jgi:hypothetical protein
MLKESILVDGKIFRNSCEALVPIYPGRLQLDQIRLQRGSSYYQQAYKSVLNEPIRKKKWARTRLNAVSYFKAWGCQLRRFLYGGGRCFVRFLTTP